MIVHDQLETPSTINLKRRLRSSETAVYDGLKYANNGIEPPHDDSLFISDVLHKSFVEVTEEGTQASATTTIDMFLSLGAREPLPVPIFRADRPFLFAIQRSGAILFLGRVVDPTRTS